MLKSIELYGFKSFADRTRIELDGGICALVGPNGSGKSNVVDAIKWALGEQSAKRLRGDEMTDVIFNGSASRSSLGAAEVTISFDNTKRQIPLDSNEINFTRRVYRNGESEYLINGRASRLKDFRDLISGAGLGSQGYAVIEQGRVEALLQSSNAQRRAVLEEAAGISRFNVKKQEALRRLERVEQNLLRLSDVVNEIEGQLRKTKSQASKAESYRVYTARVQKLRCEVALYEQRQKVEERDRLSVETNDNAKFETECAEKIQASEKAQGELSKQLEELNAKLQTIETQLVATREKIASEESALDFQLAQLNELQKEAAQSAAQALSLVSRGANDDAAARQANYELTEAKKAVKQIADDFAQENAEIESLDKRAATASQEREGLLGEQRKKTAETTRFVGELSEIETRKRSLEQTQAQKTRQRDEIERQQQDLNGEIDRLQAETKELDAKREQSFQRLSAIKQKREDARRELGARQIEFSDLERKRAAYDERANLLKDLLCKYEGLSQGVKETLKSMKDPSSPFHNAHGLVADLIRVNVEAAPLIELALGQTAQYIVVPPDPELFKYIETQNANFAGRVGFIWLDPNPHKTIPLNPKLNGRPGALGRADQFVETEPQFSALIQRLLYRTWIVESIAVAKRLYRDADEPLNFLTADGALLTADGALVVGAAQGGAGLISRRSELASLSSESEKLNADFEKLREIATQLKEELAKCDEAFETEATTQRNAVQRLDSLKLQLTAALERKAQTGARLSQLSKELKDVETELQKTNEELSVKQAAKKNFDDAVSALEAQLNESRRSLDALNTERREKTKRSTNLKIELAKAEERIVFLTERLKQLDETRGEQSRRAIESSERAKSLENRASQAELSALRGESTIAALYSLKESLTSEQQTTKREQERLERARGKATYELRSTRDALEKRRDQARTKELSLERLAQEIKTLEDRMKEDYGLDLNEVKFRYETDDDRRLQAIVDSKRGNNEETSESSTQTDSLTSEEANELVVPVDAQGIHKRKKELEELRVKLQELGSVNLEAIETLETLKMRYSSLFNQYNDLVTARRSIQKIVERVNADCKRLFEETFETVRVYFSAIFQKLFGGGRADLTLDDPANPLESGVEIVARPPGKELKSLTLMSGGEKSLTCAALLLAIFQHRTSPICVLDEVDAALDEGNVERFTNALLDFIPTTQFLLITHSKKTMSSAKSIFGVTMEDSGVSKILSVHFDDVGEDGQILIKPKSSLSEQPLAAVG